MWRPPSMLRWLGWILGQHPLRAMAFNHLSRACAPALCSACARALSVSHPPSPTSPTTTLFQAQWREIRTGDWVAFRTCIPSCSSTRARSCGAHAPSCAPRLPHLPFLGGTTTRLSSPSQPNQPLFCSTLSTFEVKSQLSPDKQVIERDYFGLTTCTQIAAGNAWRVASSLGSWPSAWSPPRPPPRPHPRSSPRSSPPHGSHCTAVPLMRGSASPPLRSPRRSHRALAPFAPPRCSRAAPALVH